MEFMNVKFEQDYTCKTYLKNAFRALQCAKLFYRQLSLSESKKPECERIVYYLIGYSLELLLKGFILSGDFSKNTRRELKNKIGHNLWDLYTLAKREYLIKLDDKEPNTIRCLGQYYRKADMRYIIIMDLRKYEKTKANYYLQPPIFYFNLIQKIM